MLTPEQVADHIGVTKYSDMRPFVVRAVKYAREKDAAPAPPVVGEDAVEAVEAVAKLVDLVIDEVLGPSVEDEPDNESVGSSMDGPLPMTFGHVREARDAIPVLRAALASSVAKPCGVKALEWSNNWSTVKAETPIGHYFIGDNRDGGFVVRFEDIWRTWASSLDTAKAAAQADYERRILSCLSHPAQGWREPEGWKPIESAPKGCVTEDAGCRGVSEWFLARPSKHWRELGASPVVVIRRRPWPHEDAWMDNGETHYVPNYFASWMPLPSAPAGGSE